MRRWIVLTLAVLASACGVLLIPGVRTAVLAQVHRAITSNPTLQRVEPFRIFDNVSYVGVRWVSAYLIDTSDGLILIDALTADFVENAIDGIRELGFDPAALKYVLITHGHRDHAGGAAELQARFGARVAMTERDWELVSARALKDGFAAPHRDVVVQDGDEITLGGTTVRFYVTPGHTPGVLSMEFDVHDGRDVHRAFVFGGVGLNFDGVARTEAYLRSVGRIRDLARGPVPVSVNLSNHPVAGGVLSRRANLTSRGESEPHPYVDTDAFLTWLDRLESRTEAKLATERGVER